MISRGRAVLFPAAFLLVQFVCSSLQADTDLEVMYIGRSPKYQSYQGHVSYYSNRTFYDDYTPYRVDVAYGLSGQDETTKRWPDPGETVTWTAKFYNRGTSMIDGFDYEWRLDGIVVDSGTYTASLDPGDSSSVSINWTWEFAEHDLVFSAMVSGDDHPSNNEVMIYTNSLGLFSFVDYGYADEFKANTASVPNPTTDSIIEWCQLHCTRLNDMFVEAGSDLRWRYDRLDLVDDYPASLPSYDRSNWDGNWPTRFTVGGSDFRFGSAYYDEDEDIDYGFLHEVGHQLGIIDIYRMDISSSQNEVTGESYYGAPAGLWHFCNQFISQHTALAMSHWHGNRRGYFGQYQFSIPTNNKLKVLSAEGLPLPGASITFYQKIESTGPGERIPDIPKFTGTTDAFGMYDIPNVSLSEKDLFWADTGDVLNDNPFGYISNHGENGVFFIKVEKEGEVDYAWLDITEFNIAYWEGSTEEATYERQVAIRNAPTLTGGLSVGVPGEPYADSFEVMKGTPPYSFSIVQGGLPAGLELFSNGTVTGTPESAADSSFVVEVVDSSATPITSEWDVTLQVLDPELWQFFQRTKRHIGTGTAPGPSAPNIIWQNRAQPGCYAPSYEDGVLYWAVGWGKDAGPYYQVRAVNMADGTTKWITSEGTLDHNSTTPAIGLDGPNADTVYAIAPKRVFAMDKSSGAFKWKIEETSNTWGYNDALIDANGYIYGRKGNYVTAIEDGGVTWTIAWQSEGSTEGRAAPALYDLYDEGEILLQTSSVSTKALRAYRLSDYAILWTYSGVSGVRTTPVIDSLNNIYVAEATTPRRVVCIDGQTGLAIWQTEIGANEYLTGCGALSMDQNTYFIASVGDGDVPSEGNLYAISTYDGSIRWTCNTKSAGTGGRREERYTCCVDNENKVYVTAQGSNENVFPNPAMTPTLCCVRDDGASGTLLWTLRLDDRPYRQAGGTSFSIGPDGTLFATITLEPLQESDNRQSLYAFRESVPPEIIDMQRNASENIEITWRSQYGVTYCVEASTDDYGGSMTWTVVDDNVPSGGAVTTWEDIDTPTSGKKFYRICIKGTGG